MFHFNQNYQTIFNFQNLKAGSYQLPTTTHNSPGSLKTSSAKLEDSPLNCSFDEGSQSNHASAIWDASVKYLQASLKNFVNNFSGFNDEAITSNQDKQSLISQQKSIQEIIYQNTLLKTHEIHQFIGNLQNQYQLQNLLRQLSNKFNPTIFNELAYVIFKIWQKKQNNKNNLKKSKNIYKQQSIIPHFNCFWGDQQQQEIQQQKKLAKFSWAPIFQAKNIQDTLIQADKCCDQIAQEIFFERKIKLLNLKQAYKYSDQFQTVVNFTQFFRTLTRSIYLSLQGFFAQPKDQCQTQIIEQFIDINIEQFDFDFNQISDLQIEQQNQNKRFVRSYDQVFQDNEENFEFCSIPNKKRKLQ